jgi:hypothetical protein
MTGTTSWKTIPASGREVNELPTRRLDVVGPLRVWPETERLRAVDHVEKRTSDVSADAEDATGRPVLEPAAYAAAARRTAATILTWHPQRQRLPERARSISRSDGSDTSSSRRTAVRIIPGVQ